MHKFNHLCGTGATMSVTTGTDIINTSAGQKYLWVTNGEPHSIRRREILNRYGAQIRKLYGYDYRTGLQVRTLHWSTPLHTHSINHMSCYNSK